MHWPPNKSKTVDTIFTSVKVEKETDRFIIIGAGVGGAGDGDGDGAPVSSSGRK